jgi:hypothetical protein
MMQRFVLNLITNVTNLSCTESHEAALCTEHDYQRHHHNVHRFACCSFVYWTWLPMSPTYLAQSRLKQRCVLNLIIKVTNLTCTESHEAALCTELGYQRHQNNVHRVAWGNSVYWTSLSTSLNITCTKWHEAALCTELDYQRLQHNVHRVAWRSFVYLTWIPTSPK